MNRLLSPLQQHVLLALLTIEREVEQEEGLSGDMAIYLWAIADEAVLGEEEAREVLGGLRRLGLVRARDGLRGIDAANVQGMGAGRGYRLTELGIQLARGAAAVEA